MADDVAGGQPEPTAHAVALGGYLVVMVPHRHLYERRPDLPSRWNPEHCRFYTAASLLAEIEEALPLASFRVRHVADNDDKYNYALPAHEAPRGCFEIELVIERIAPPGWTQALAFAPEQQALVDRMDALVYQAVAAALRLPAAAGASWQQLIHVTKYFTPWHRLWHHFVDRGAPELGGERVTEEALRAAVRPLLDKVEVDADFYRRTYAPVATAHQQGKIRDLAAHWRDRGYFGSRLGSRWDADLSAGGAGKRQDDELEEEQP